MRFVDHPRARFPAPMSALGFGCSALLGRSSRHESLAALTAAVDSGITFFDTARSYGYGEAEGLLGEFLAGRREQFVLCTKFGILPAARGWKHALRPLARAAVNAIPALRGVARRAAAGELVANNFTVDVLHRSLHASLRALRTDYVDMLLLHAAPASTLAQDDLLEALARLVEAGKVRLAGISGELPVIAQTFATRPAALGTAQFAADPARLGFLQQASANSDLLLVANHPFGGPTGVGAVRTLLAKLQSDASIDAPIDTTLREKLAVKDAALLPEVILNAILAPGTGIAAVVPAMMNIAHLRANVCAVEQCRFTPMELTQLRAAIVGISETA
jgi:aryl-alcohol dehydrogenase-like predicted oxidoreductase